jgi:hypothetical protein
MCPALDILSRTTRPCAVTVDALQSQPMFCARSRTHLVGGTTFVQEQSELFLPALTSSLAAERSLSSSRSADGWFRPLLRSPVRAGVAELSL